MANPGCEFGAEVDVDVVVNLTGAEHPDSERLAGAARGAVGCDQPGGARGKSLAGVAIAQCRGHAGRVLHERRQLGTEAEIDLRIGEGMVAQRRLKRVLCRHANVGGTVRSGHVPPRRLDAADFPSGQRFRPR